MSAPPDLFRRELIHPMVVHAPLALLLAGAALRLLSLPARREGRWGFLVPAAQLALAAGVAAAWLAVVTGGIADGVVGHTLCDPTVAKSHEQHAETATMLFSAAVLVDLGATWLRGPRGGSPRRWLLGAMALALVAGSGVLARAGHLGARLVYEQGAAVHRPSVDCAEFE